MNDAELGAMIERPRLSGLHLVPVLAGGGTRLAAHVGVLAALDDLGVRYARIVGVSGGSIVAALRAAGWSPARMLELVLDINFARFRGRSLVELIQRGGLSSGDGFEEWLDTQLEGKSFVEPRPTSRCRTRCAARWVFHCCFRFNRGRVGCSSTAASCPRMRCTATG